MDVKFLLLATVSLICFTYAPASKAEECPNCAIHPEELNKMRIDKFLGHLKEALDLDNLPTHQINMSDPFLPGIKIEGEALEDAVKRIDNAHGIVPIPMDAGSAPVVTLLTLGRVPNANDFNNELTTVFFLHHMMPTYPGEVRFGFVINQNFDLKTLTGPVGVDVFIREKSGHIIKRIGEAVVMIEDSNASQKTWIVLDNEFSSNILSYKNKSIGIYVKTTDLNNRSEINGLILHENDARKTQNMGSQMFLEVSAASMPPIRSRRAVDEDTCTSMGSKDKCCVDNLRISFEELGWKFVLSPKIFTARACTGSCENAIPRNVHTSLIQKSATKPFNYVSCCHPVEYTNLEIIYFTENNVIVKRTLPNMVVEKCGCY